MKLEFFYLGQIYYSMSFDIITTQTCFSGVVKHNKRLINVLVILTCIITLKLYLKASKSYQLEYVEQLLFYFVIGNQSAIFLELPLIGINITWLNAAPNIVAAFKQW